MKRLTYAALPILALVFLFLFAPAISIPSTAQAGGRTGTPSEADPREPETLETETSETETSETETSEAETSEYKLPEEEPQESEPSDTKPTEPEITEPDMTEPETSEAETKPVPESGLEPETKPQIGYRTASPSNILLAPPDSAPIELVDRGIGKYNENRIHLLMQGQSSASLSLHLEDLVNFYKGDDWREVKGVRFSINYETEDFDSTYGNQTGLFFLTVSLNLEDDRYCLASELSTELMIPVFVYDLELPAYLPPLNMDAYKHDVMESFNILTDVHADIHHITDMLSRDYPTKLITLYFEGGYHLELPNTWDLSSVSAGTPGIYTAYRSPDLPLGVLLEDFPVEDIPLAKCSINIQDPGVFTLSSPFSQGNNLSARWLYPTPDRSRIHARYRIGDGTWTSDTTGYLMDLREAAKGKLYLNTWEMKKYPTYLFQLEYDGVYSSVMEICINEDGFYVPNEGDRDGVDRDAPAPPNIILPPETSAPESSDEGSSGSGNSQGGESGNHSSSEAAGAGSDSLTGYGPGHQTEPDSDSLPTAETAPVTLSANENVTAITGQIAAGTVTQPSAQSDTAMEADTLNASVWSGTRIQNYIKMQPGLPFVFEKHDIRVTIPADSPALSQFFDTDFLQVEIEALSSDTVRLTISKNGTPLTGLSMTVTMPWAGEHTEELQVKNEAGSCVGSAGYDNKKDYITFTITQSGTYHLESKHESDDALPAANQPDTEASSEKKPGGILAAFIAATLLALASFGVIAFTHYKRKGE